MKSLKEMPAVAAGLAKIAQRASVKYDNGTKGLKIQCYLWEIQEMSSPEHKKLSDAIVLKKLAKQDYSAEKAQLDALPAPEAMMVFKLVQPRYVQGTKVFVVGGQNESPKVKDCTYIHIPQEIVDGDLITYTDVDGEFMPDATNQDAQVITLDLKGCMLDVKEGKRDRFNPMKWYRAPRVYVTDMPFRAFQVAASVLRKEEMDKYRRWDMMTDDEMKDNL